MIYKELTKTMFMDEFYHMGRGDQFSYEGLSCLYDYLDQEDSYELDVIAICCDFVEIKVSDITQETGLESLEELEDTTLVLEVDDETIIYQPF